MKINSPPLDKNLSSEKKYIFPVGNGTILLVPSQTHLSIPLVLNISLTPNLWQCDLAFALATLYLSDNHINIVVDRERLKYNWAHKLLPFGLLTYSEGRKTILKLWSLLIVFRRENATLLSLYR